MPTNRISIAPTMLRWAAERSGRSADELANFPLDAWLAGAAQPTMKQLERFAKMTYTSIGFLFLTGPPEEQVPIPGFQTFSDAAIRRATRKLLDTIYSCEARQDWFRDFCGSERSRTCCASR